jgi:GNAT superfamily N-acetyltransferase
MNPRYSLRAALPQDVPAIAGLVEELAVFEQLEHLLKLTPEALQEHLFGPRPVIEAWVGVIEGEVVAYAICFTSYSTFLGKPGLYLEDLYVRPAHRRSGLGKGMLKHLAALALQRGYGRFEWTVLDWNEDAIRFYQRMGADLLPDWRICRATGDALERMAG